MKPKLILIGGGGHCASCIDVIEREAKFQIAGIVDNASATSELLGYPVLGGDERLEQLRTEYEFALVTVGQIRTPSVRVRLYEQAKAIGFVLPTIISPRAYVSPHARLGGGTIIMHDALINARAAVGNNCIINSKALIEHDSIIEDDCHISTAATVNGGCLVRRGSFVGSNAVTKESVQTREKDFIKAGSVFVGYAHE